MVPRSYAAGHGGRRPAGVLPEVEMKGARGGMAEESESVPVKNGRWPLQIKGSRRNCGLPAAVIAWRQGRGRLSDRCRVGKRAGATRSA